MKDITKQKLFVPVISTFIAVLAMTVLGLVASGQMGIQLRFVC
jgi:hypothetical protein